MKTYIYIITFLSFICNNNIYSQDPPPPVISVKNIKVISLDTTYSPKYKNPVRKKRRRLIQDEIINTYIYKLELVINTDGQLFNFPLAITCHYPEGKRSIIVNQNRSISTMYYWSETAEELFNYSMIIETNEKGNARITLDKWDPANLIIDYESEIIFKDYIFRLE